MTIRVAAVAFMAAGLAFVAAPSSAQEERTFKAWGHEFIVPGSQPFASTEHRAVREVTGPDSARRAHTSVSASPAAPVPAVRPQVTRRIDVRRARLTGPAE